MHKYFKLVLAGNQLQPEFVGFEIENDVAWVYQEVIGVNFSSAIIISNKVLFDQFEDQQNLVHVSYRGETKSVRLNRRKDIDKINF